ncbi:MAG: chromosome partitioning ATPase [Lautropia sp.]|nr:chromosome partitioning ATPase [Lautropia sp.]
MNKRLVHRAMQKLVDQNPSRPLPVSNTAVMPSSIPMTRESISQDTDIVRKSSTQDDDEEAMAASIREDIAKAEALREARERQQQNIPSTSAQAQAHNLHGSVDLTNGTAPDSMSLNTRPDAPAQQEMDRRVAPRQGLGGRPIIEIDFDYLKTKGFLVPDDKTAKIHQEFRLVKRRLLDNAFGRLRPVVDDGRLIMVTSSLPSEGKTFSAINLAISIAIGDEHPVLLLDADIARPSIANTLQLDIPDEVGLTDYLENPDIPIEELLHETSLSGLTLMTAGHLKQRPVDLLASNTMAQLVERLKNMLPHHVIVFDTPPLLPVTETRSLSALVGQVVLVVAAGETPRSAVNESLLQLEDCEAVGLLFNKAPVQPKAPAYYGY